MLGSEPTLKRTGSTVNIPVGVTLLEDGPVLPKKAGSRTVDPILFFCPVPDHGRLTWYHTEGGILFCPICKQFSLATLAQEGKEQHGRSLSDREVSGDVGSPEA